MAIVNAYPTKLYQLFSQGNDALQLFSDPNNELGGWSYSDAMTFTEHDSAEAVQADFQTRSLDTSKLNNFVPSSLTDGSPNPDYVALSTAFGNIEPFHIKNEN